MRNELDVMNPAPRCPVILILDTSASMKGEPIAELNTALRQFIREVAADEAASMSVELEIIPMTATAEPVIPFTPIDRIDPDGFKLTANGGTFTGKAMTRALADIQARKELYVANAICAYAPWVIMMSDGKPGDNWRGPSEKLLDLAARAKLTYLGLELGLKSNHDFMKQMLPPEPGPLRLNEVKKFKRFFRWLTSSLESVSRSCVGNEPISFCLRSWQDL